MQYDKIIMNRYYTLSTIETMNYTSTWNHCIKFSKSKSKSDILYELHPTGECDLNGRKYIALPKNTNINDPNIRKKYNLI